MTKEQYTLMNTELVRVVQFLKTYGIHPILSGSYALCAYAGNLVGNPQDIDFLFRSREEHDQAVSLLENKLAFQRLKQITWKSEGKKDSVNTKLISPKNVEFDLAYTMGDIALTLDPARTIIVEQFPVPILSLEDIRKSYQRFFHEKPGSQSKINLANELLEQ